MSKIKPLLTIVVYIYGLVSLCSSFGIEMDNFLKRYSSTSTIYNAMSQDERDRRMSIYDNVPTPTTIDKRIVNQIKKYNGEEEDIGIRSHILRRHKVTHHYKRCFCKIENAFLRFDFISLISLLKTERQFPNPRDEVEALQSVLTLKDLEMEMMKADLCKVYAERVEEQACHLRTVNDFTVIQ